MAKSEAKPLTVRRPLRDVANNIGGGGRASRSVSAVPAKKLAAEKENEDTLRVRDQREGEGDEGEDKRDVDDSLDRLLVVQSDLSALVRQVDELVVQAFKSKSTSKQRRKEVDSFANVLSDMLASLKPWVPRFQKALSSHSMESESQSIKPSVSHAVSVASEAETEDPKSPDKMNMDLLISPSPLVSWRANCTTEDGRQLFLLTPLPFSKGISSKHQDPPKSVFERVNSDASKNLFSFNSISIDSKCDLLQAVEIKPTPAEPSGMVANEISTPLMLSKSKHPMIVMTPCLKRSPPKSCLLLEAVSESSHRHQARVRRSTPFPVGIKCSDSDISESSSGSEGSQNLALKYPELLGIQCALKSVVTKKHIEDSPDWFRSPPKTCILIEPTNEKTLLNDTKDTVDTQGVSQLAKTIHLQEPLDGNLKLVESTPIWKESQSTCRKGKRPGEITLKKELWAKFEAASTNGLRFNVSLLGETSQKGFLDRLDEVSCDGEI